MLVSKRTNNKWTYNLTNHLIALVSMTYIADLDAYELHPRTKKSSMALLMNAKVLNYTYDRGSLLFKSIFV